MSSLFAWPLLGASLLAGAALGLHLGESTIGLIDPVHKRGPALDPRAWEPQVAGPGRSYSDLYGWDEGRMALADDCGDCAALAARDAHSPADEGYSAVVPYFGEERSGVEVIRVHSLLEEEQMSVTDDEPGDSVLRYAYYPIEAEDERTEADERDETPAVASDTTPGTAFALRETPGD